MKKKTNSNKSANLQSRLATAEFNIARLSETLYDLIARLQELPDPPCPPMCGAADSDSAKPTHKKRKSKKKGS